MILRPILTNVFNISKHTENYNDDKDEEIDTKISIIIYREALTCLNINELSFKDRRSNLFDKTN